MPATNRWARSFARVTHEGWPAMLDMNAAFATFPVLETPRLRLRAVRPGDAADVFRIRADERVMRYFGSSPMHAPEQAVEKINGFVADFANQRGIRWPITWRAEDRLIGSCAFWRLVNEHGWAEIGYDLAPDHWGQGVVPEALHAALGWGFATLRLHRVEAQIDPANHGSRRVLEKCGFVQEAYFRENYYANGRFADTAVFSLLNARWMEHAKQSA